LLLNLKFHSCATLGGSGTALSTFVHRVWCNTNVNLNIVQKFASLWHCSANVPLCAIYCILSIQGMQRMNMNGLWLYVFYIYLYKECICASSQSNCKYPRAHAPKNWLLEMMRKPNVLSPKVLKGRSEIVPENLSRENPRWLEFFNVTDRRQRQLNQWRICVHHLSVTPLRSSLLKLEAESPEESNRSLVV
jgi:hypothetical protein